MKKSLTIWLIGDGKPGHENQSLGLSEALARQVPCELHRISIAGNQGLVKRIKTANQAAGDLPRPDLVIAAGHATHPSLLWLARRHHSRSVVLMKPSLPMGWFDACVVPSHDFKPGFERPNLLITRGALNRVVPPVFERKAGKILLIGGPSANHGWDSTALLEKIGAITAEGGWELADSRRTPPGFINEISRKFPEVRVFRYQDTTPDWLPSKLGASEDVWVTEDSVSMMYEALSSGSRVGLLPVPRLMENSRVLRGVEQLIRDGFLTPYAIWKETKKLPPPPEILREADRCARELLRMFGLS